MDRQAADNGPPSLESCQELFAVVRAECSSASWSRGVELARAGRVVSESAARDELVLKVASGARRVSPTVTLWPADAEWSCDCGASEDPCHHVAAAVIALRRAAEQGRPLTTASATGGDRLGYRFFRADGALRFSRALVGSGEPRALTSTALALRERNVPVTKEDLRVEHALGQHVAGGRLPPAAMERLLAALSDLPGSVTLDGRPVRIGAPAAGERVSIGDDGDGFIARRIADPHVAEVFRNGVLLTNDGVLRAVKPPPLPARQWEQLRRGLHVGVDGAAELAAEVIPRLRQQLIVELQTRRLPRAEPLPPRLRVEVSRSGDQLVALPTIVYGDPPVARVDSDALRLLRRDQPLPLRDRRAEQQLQGAARARLGVAPGVPLRGAGQAAVELARTLRQLDATTEVVGTAHQDCVVRGTLAPLIDADGGQPACRFAAPDASLATVEAERVLAAWRDGETVLPLADGSFGALPVDWLERFGQRVADLLAWRRDGEAAAPAAKLELARLCAELDQPRPPDLERLRLALEDFEQLPPAAVEPRLAAALRDYQRRGVDWLCLLREARLGALLADDMGLGKTLQALCALRSPALVVAPTSVLHAWIEQCSRWRPELRYQLYHGPTRSLDQEADLTLTSYALLRRDLEQLQQVRWHTLVLDEAQAIKNPTSQVARAACALEADWRLALTGTPVENRLEELWSLFHFLARGLLGARSDFTARVTADPDQLLARVRPLTLRRRKAEVAHELPPRIEVIARCELGEREREIYDSVQLAARPEAIRQLDRGNVIGALEALLRLRQAACHVGLLPGQSGGCPSSKLQLLRGRLAELVAAEHKALVFSQWTSLLDLVEPALRDDGLALCRLDGSTRDRRGVVESFQRPAGPSVMLISLKAGGVGLTLTAADHVFLLDPWWNPAVEDQAADRAHRLGQLRPVVIHRLIAEETVEEKILALQQHKRALAEAALAGTAESASLSREEIKTLLL